MCKKLAKPGSVFYFLQCPLPLYVGTNYQIQRNWSHYSINIIPCRILCESMLSPSVKVYKCSHSLNIRSFYASHFCNNKKTPKEKNKNKQTTKTKPKRKIPQKQTNKNVLPLYRYWRLRLCLNSMYVTSKVKGYKTLKT